MSSALGRTALQIGMYERRVSARACAPYVVPKMSQRRESGSAVVSLMVESAIEECTDSHARHLREVIEKERFVRLDVAHARCAAGNPCRPSACSTRALRDARAPPASNRASESRPCATSFTRENTVTFRPTFSRSSSVTRLLITPCSSRRRDPPPAGGGGHVHLLGDVRGGQIAVLLQDFQDPQVRRDRARLAWCVP